MSRVKRYIDDIRAELADPRKERWSDSRLLSLLSDSQAELAHELRVLVSRISLPIIQGVREYTLPSDADILLRAYSPDGPVDKVSHYEMDAKDPTWEFDTGPKVEKVIYDLLTPNKIILYPTPNQDGESLQYNFSAGDEEAYVGSEYFGVVTSIDNYTFNTNLGEITDLFQPGFEEVFSQPYGVITNISQVINNLVVQYSRRPAVLTSLNSDLELGESFKLALVHLTCFRAFSADLDTQSGRLASTHFQLYNNQLARLKNNAAANQSKGNTAREISRRVF